MRQRILMLLLIANGIMLSLNSINSNWPIILLNLITIFFIIKTLTEEFEWCWYLLQSV